MYIRNGIRSISTRYRQIWLNPTNQAPGSWQMQLFLLLPLWKLNNSVPPSTVLGLLAILPDRLLPPPPAPPRHPRTPVPRTLLFQNYQPERKNRAEDSGNKKKEALFWVHRDGSVIQASYEYMSNPATSPTWRGPVMQWRPGVPPPRLPGSARFAFRPVDQSSATSAQSPTRRW